MLIFSTSAKLFRATRSLVGH